MFETFLTHIKIFAADPTIACNPGQSFFDFPTWYKYICGRNFVIPDDIPLVALAIIEIMLRISALVAIAYAVFGAVKYVVSQGEANKVSEAKGTIINALAGLMISTLAIAIVAFIGNRIG